MFDSPLRPALELQLDGQVLRFDSAADFEFALRGRTDVTGEDSASLMSLSDDELSTEIARLEREHAFLRDQLGRSLESGEDLDARLARIDPGRWRTEHRWDEILRALADCPTATPAVKQTAVSAYLDYLRTRADVAVAIAGQRGHRESDTPSGAGSTRGSVDPDIERRGREVRLTRDEPTPVLERDRDTAHVRFAQHRFRLERDRSAGAVALVDTDGRRWNIPPGESTIGRSPACAIAIRAVLKDISRAHATVTLDRSDRVWLTDTSSRGTFVMRDKAVGVDT